VSIVSILLLNNQNKINVGATESNFFQGDYTGENNVYTEVDGYGATVNIKNYEGTTIASGYVNTTSGNMNNFYMYICGGFENSKITPVTKGENYYSDYFSLFDLGYTSNFIVYSEYSTTEGMVILGRDTAGNYKNVYFSVSAFNGQTIDFYVLKDGETLTSVETDKTTVTINYLNKYGGENYLSNCSKIVFLDNGFTMGEYDYSEFSFFYGTAVGYEETDLTVSNTNNEFNIKYVGINELAECKIKVILDVKIPLILKVPLYGYITVNYFDVFPTSVQSYYKSLLIEHSGKVCNFYGILTYSPDYDNEDLTNEKRQTYQDDKIISLSQLDSSKYSGLFEKLINGERITLYSIRAYMLLETDEDYIDLPKDNTSNIGDTIGKVFAGLGSGLGSGLKKTLLPVGIFFIVVIVGLIVYKKSKNK